MASIHLTPAQRRGLLDHFRIRLDGAQYHDILQYASENGWGVGERQLRTYIARADRLLIERTETGREFLFARHVAMQLALYARAFNAADYAHAKDAFDFVLGGTPDLPYRFEFPELSPDELKRANVLIAELAARRAGKCPNPSGPASGR